MKKRHDRREIETFSLSFLDCICCGFGAIILLLVLSEFGQPLVLERSREDLEGQVRALQQELNTIRGETDLLNRELQGRIEELQRQRMRLQRLSGDLSEIQGQFAASRQESSVSNIVETELVSAYQTLTAEMQRLLKERPNRPKTEAVGGIPIDSEYIIFVIDTSASMLSNHWQSMQVVMREILDIYPRVKGIQIMDDEGKELLPTMAGRWISDSPEQRENLLDSLSRWRAFSNSSPVEGIAAAIRKYWAPDKRISIYVIGDEFTGDSIQEALNAVAQVNKPDAKGRRLVRIHAIGFPAGKNMTPFTNIRFSALMRLMCEQNNGTFVGITG
jgi:hypothetical protein